MPKQAIKTLHFPMGGLYRRVSYQRQSPYTTPDCSNVRPDGTILGRERGGQRPGLEKAFAQQLGGGNPIRFLNSVQFVNSSNTLSQQLVASSNGQLWRDAVAGTMSQLTTDLTLTSAEQIDTAERLQKIYIADNSVPVSEGTDGTKGSSAITFDAPSVSDWTTEGIDTDDMVLVIYNSSDTVTLLEGTYEISSVAAGEITLATTCNTQSGTPTASFYIARCPKIYDPVADTLTRWVATAGKGQVPTGCPIIALWRDRLVLAGGFVGPHAWYMSRQGDPLDFDYSPSEPTDPQRAVAGATSDAGLLGEPLTALIPHSDDCMLMGCLNSLWIVRGDPAHGGIIDNLSREIGVVDTDSWCYTPEGYLFFLSLDGVYVMAPGCGSTPRSVSRELLPEELLNIDKDTVTISMEYDVRDRGIHLYLSDSSGPDTHWWLDIKQTETGDNYQSTFWPMALQATHEPFSAHAQRYTTSDHSQVMLGSRDGYIRRFAADQGTDDGGNTIVSSVTLGPFALGMHEGAFEGLLKKLEGVTAASSGDVDWEVRVGATAEAAYGASATATGEWNTAGLNAKSYPRLRGAFATVTLKNGEAASWAIEDVKAAIQTAGERRLV